MFEGLLHVGDDGFGGGGGIDDGGDEADVVVDVDQSVWGEGKDGQARFENGGEGLHAVGDADDDEVGASGEDLVGVGSPTVVEDRQVVRGEPGDRFEAVFGDGAEVVEAIERLEDDRDGGLEGSYAHGCISDYRRG